MSTEPAKTTPVMVTKENATFEEWCAELERENTAGGEPFYPHGVIASTGEECWRGWYDDGWDAGDALQEDLSHAD
jgi:hypothetical protein